MLAHAHNCERVFACSLWDIVKHGQYSILCSLGHSDLNFPFKKLTASNISLAPKCLISQNTHFPPCRSEMESQNRII